MTEYLLVLKFIGLLILVVLLAYFAIKFGLQRFQPSTGRGYIGVIQKVPLDLKGDRLLILIRIGERILLLGSAQANISLLYELPAEELSLLSDNPVQPDKKNLFSVLLEGYRRKNKSGKEGTGL